MAATDIPKVQMALIYGRIALIALRGTMMYASPVAVDRYILFLFQMEAKIFIRRQTLRHLTLKIRMNDRTLANSFISKHLTLITKDHYLQFVDILLVHFSAHHASPIKITQFVQENYNRRFSSKMRSSQSEKEGLMSGIVNERVRQIIGSRVNVEELLRHPREAKRRHKEEIKEHQHYLNQYEERKWLMKKGKKHMIDFDNLERKKMKQYFNTLDSNKTGQIGVDQLEQLLFSVGLVQTREEIKALIDSVDQGKTGKIQFSEFLSMIQNDQGQNQEIVSFFKSLIGETCQKRREMLKVEENKEKPLPKASSVHKELKTITQTRSSLYLSNDKSINRSSLLLKKSKDDRHSFLDKPKAPQITEKYPYPKGLSFQMVVSHIRRKYMMTALNIGKSPITDNYTSSKAYQENTIEQIAKGQKVMQSLQKMYQRKLIKQIKENKRCIDNSFKTSQTKTEPNLLKLTFNHKFNRVI